MDSERIDYERRVLGEIELESRVSCVVYQSVSFVQFVSHSKGRNRKRTRPVGVELIGYQGRYSIPEKFPYDTVSTEIYGRSDANVESRLRREIPLLAKTR